MLTSPFLAKEGKSIFSQMSLEFALTRCIEKGTPFIKIYKLSGMYGNIKTVMLTSSLLVLNISTTL